MGRGSHHASKEVIRIKKSIAFYLALTGIEQQEIKDGNQKMQNLKHNRRYKKSERTGGMLMKKLHFLLMTIAFVFTF